MKDVLIIDQTKPVRVRLVDICKSMHLNAHEAFDSTSAINALNKHNGTIGFIIMEIKFDQFDGFALLERIKHQYSNIPIMILTSSNRRTDFVLGLKSGAVDYVLKPFDDINLITRISKFMRDTKKSNSLNKAPADVSVNIKDMIQMEIKKAQKGKYEFELFMLLLYKPVKEISSRQDDEYETYLNKIYPEIESIFWETDHLTKFGTQLVLGVLPFCNEDGFNVAMGKLDTKLKSLQNAAVFPSDYKWVHSHQLMPDEGVVDAKGVIDTLQMEVRKQIALDKKISKEAAEEISKETTP